MGVYRARKTKCFRWFVKKIRFSSLLLQLESKSSLANEFTKSVCQNEYISLEGFHLGLALIWPVNSM